VMMAVMVPVQHRNSNPTRALEFRQT